MGLELIFSKTEIFTKENSLRDKDLAVVVMKAKIKSILLSVSSKMAIGMGLEDFALKIAYTWELF